MLKSHNPKQSVFAQIDVLEVQVFIQAVVNVNKNAAWTEFKLKIYEMSNYFLRIF